MKACQCATGLFVRPTGNELVYWPTVTWENWHGDMIGIWVVSNTRIRTRRNTPRSAWNVWLWWSKENAYATLILNLAALCNRVRFWPCVWFYVLLLRTFSSRWVIEPSTFSVPSDSSFWWIARQREKKKIVYTTIQRFGVNTYIFSKDILRWSKRTLKTFINVKNHLY